MHIRQKQDKRFSLGSFSWFDEIPLLQALEAILEDTALWLQGQHITAGEGGRGDHHRQCFPLNSMPNSHTKLNHPIHVT